MISKNIYDNSYIIIYDPSNNHFSYHRTAVDVVTSWINFQKGYLKSTNIFGRIMRNGKETSLIYRIPYFTTSNSFDPEILKTHDGLSKDDPDLNNLAPTPNLEYGQEISFALDASTINPVIGARSLISTSLEIHHQYRV